jgi:tripartite-type tricarboxylate transporter receptor subunit TctC
MVRLVDRWFGILAPTDTPPAVVKRLRDEVAKAVAAPDVVDRLAQQGMGGSQASPSGAPISRASSPVMRRS